MTFICYPKCTTCHKALSWLESTGISFEIRDIKENNPSYKELKAWYKSSGLDIKKFFNTSGLKYKELSLKDKLPGMTDDEKLRLLASDGMLVKRPILIADDTVLIGFRENEWKEKLGL